MLQVLFSLKIEKKYFQLLLHLQLRSCHRKPFLLSVLHIELIHSSHTVVSTSSGRLRHLRAPGLNNKGSLTLFSLLFLSGQALLHY